MLVGEAALLAFRHLGREIETPAFMKQLLGVLNGPSGKPSSMRVSALVVVFVIMGTWSYVSVKKMELQPFSETEVALIVCSLGIKAWQKTKEAPIPAQP